MRPDDTENEMYQDEFNFGTLKDLDNAIKKKWPRTPRKNIKIEMRTFTVDECSCHWKAPGFDSYLTILVVRRVVKKDK